MTDKEDIVLASYLVQCGLRDRWSPANDKRYTKAISKWQESDVFQDLTNSVATGMGLVIAGVNEKGIALRSSRESIFKPDPDRLLHHITQEEKAMQSAIIVHIAYLCFPDDHSMMESSDPQMITAKEVLDILLKVSTPDIVEQENDVRVKTVKDVIWENRDVIFQEKTNKFARGSLRFHILTVFGYLDRSGFVDYTANIEDPILGSIKTKDKFRKIVKHNYSEAFKLFRAGDL